MQDNVCTGNDTRRDESALRLQNKIKHIPPDWEKSNIRDAVKAHHSDQYSTQVRTHEKITLMHGGSDMIISSIIHTEDKVVENRAISTHSILCDITFQRTTSYVI